MTSMGKRGPRRGQHRATIAVARLSGGHQKTFAISENARLSSTDSLT